MAGIGSHVTRMGGSTVQCLSHREKKKHERDNFFLPIPISVLPTLSGTFLKSQVGKLGPIYIFTLERKVDHEKKKLPLPYIFETLGGATRLLQ